MMLKWVICGALLLSQLLFGCGGDELAARKCQVKQSLLDEFSACVEDDDCPCGSGCELGVCRAACFKNSECESGERCNEFGRCAPGKSDLIAPVEVEELPAELVMSTSVLASRTGAEAMLFTVRAPEGAPSAAALRISAERGLSIHCAPPGQSQASDASSAPCELSTAEPVEVTVVPDEALAPGESRAVSVHWNNQSRDVSYFLASDTLQFHEFEPVGAPTGHYEGLATLRRVGSGIVPEAATAPDRLDGTTRGVDSVVELSIPLTLDVFENVDGFLARLDDPMRVLSSSGLIEAQLQSTGAGSLQWISDSQVFVESALATEADDAGRGFEGLHARYGYRAEQAGILTGEVIWPEIKLAEIEAGAFSFDLPVYFDTMAHPQRTAAAVWRLSFSRVSDVDAGAAAPSAPSGDAEVHAASRDGKTRLALTRWEASLAPKVVESASYGSVLTGGEVSDVGVCANGRALSGAERDALYKDVSNKVLGLLLFNEPDGEIANGEVTVTFDGLGIPETAGPIPALTAKEFMRVGGIPDSFSTLLRYTMHASIEPQTRVITSSGEPVEHLDVPCAFEGRMRYRNVNTNQQQINSGLLTADICDELSEQTGCVVHDRFKILTSLRASSFETAGNLGAIDFTNSAWADQTTSNFIRQATRFCTMPEVPIECAEAIACHSGDADDLLTSSTLVDSFFSETGDAICEGSFRSFAIDADENPQGLSAGEMFAACTAELEGVTSPAGPGDDLFESLSSPACMNHSRFFTALGAASHQLRVSDVAPVSWPAVDNAERMTLRLLVQWIRIHGYIASEMNEQHLLQEILRRDPVGGATAPPTMEVVLPTSLRGWDVLLHPRFSNAIDNISGEALASVDYRLERFGGAIPADAGDDPSESLSEAMLDTLRSQAELATVILEQARFSGDPSAIGFMSPVLRYSVVINSLAEELAQRAVLACESDTSLCNGAALPPWYARFERGRVRTRVALQKLVATANSLLQGSNPLGIEDSDLPLYFANTPDSDDGRFFAISDYLVGTSPEDFRAWAPPLVEEAERRLQSARAKWVERQDRAVATQRDSLARADRVVDAMTEYGDRIINLCGRPGELISGDALIQWEAFHGRPFSADDCFLDLSDDRCRIDPSASLDLFGTAEAQYSVCHFQELDRLSGGLAFYGEPGLTEFARECPASAVTYLESGCAASTTGACLRCSSGAVADAPVSGGNFLEVLLKPGADLTVINAADDSCRNQFANAIVPLPTIQDKTGDIPVDCFRGAIGEQAAALRSVATEIDVARRELSEMTKAYDLAVSACNRQRLTGQKLIDAQEAHNEQLTVFRAIKLAADIAAAVAGGAKDCADSAGSDNKGASPATCAAAGIEAAATSVSVGMDFAIDQLESAFDLRNLEIEVEGEHEVCMIESRQYVVATESQALRIRRALEDLEAAMVVFENLRASAKQAFDDGLATVEFEQGRRISPLTQDLWIDEDVQGFDTAFRIAKRVTYLSVVAVEYEFQQSIGLRGTTLAAELPADLTAVLRDLRTFTGTRSVFGSRPTKRKAILSLRDQLLDLEDRSDVPAGEISLTAAERLQLRLRSPNNAVFDEDGQYIGQEISFSIAPSDVGLQADGVALIFSQDSCAERLWSVNASILGGDDLLRGQANTFTNLTIKKANTFYSQWCDDDGQEAPYQLASVRPERNLFRDPEAAGASFIDSQLSALVGSTFSKALIQPSLNVERVEFEDDKFENGESSQLAARGLFGEYTIFFPAQALSILNGDTQSDGLDLTKIEDVLIRFDYVSAAR